MVVKLVVLPPLASFSRAVCSPRVAYSRRVP